MKMKWIHNQKILQTAFLFFALLSFDHPFHEKQRLCYSLGHQYCILLDFVCLRFGQYIVLMFSIFWCLFWHFSSIIHSFVGLLSTRVFEFVWRLWLILVASLFS
jgi:hypothetical protein